jgi:hypothetical protein
LRFHPTHQRPIALHGIQAAQQELPGAQHVLDDSEDGLDGGVARGVAGLARAREQPMRIELGPGVG